MDRMTDLELPAHAYIPGGPYPRPSSSEAPIPIDEDDPLGSDAYIRGCSLFNAGHYWEAHEAWEGLWHAHRRRGPIADLLKGLIKLAAAGVKVRQGQPRGVITHASRAAGAIQRARQARGRNVLGLDLDALITHARRIESSPPTSEGSLEDPLERVFDLVLEPYAERKG